MPKKWRAYKKAQAAEVSSRTWLIGGNLFWRSNASVWGRSGEGQVRQFRHLSSADQASQPLHLPL